MILDNGVWDITVINNKRKKYRNFFFVLSLIPIYLIYLAGFDSENPSAFFVIVGIIGFLVIIGVAGTYINLIDEKAVNFNSGDLNPILNEITLKFEKELEELVSLKNDINNLEKLKSKLELKKITEFNRK